MSARRKRSSAGIKSQSSVFVTGLRPITSNAGHKRALRQIDELMNSRAGSKRNAYLEALGVLVHHYERTLFPTKGGTQLVRPYNETVWNRFWRDPEFAMLLAEEVAGLNYKRPKPLRKSKSKAK